MVREAVISGSTKHSRSTGWDSMSFEFYSAEAADEASLWDFLATAAYEQDGAAARAVPMVAAHLSAWPRAGDFRLIAEVDGTALGAVGSPNCAGGTACFLCRQPHAGNLSRRDGGRARAGCRFSANAGGDRRGTTARRQPLSECLRHEPRSTPLREDRVRAGGGLRPP